MQEYGESQTEFYYNRNQGYKEKKQKEKIRKDILM